MAKQTDVPQTAEPHVAALRRRTGSIGLTLARASVPAVLIMLWAIASQRTDLVPGVVETFEALVDGFLDGSIHDDLAATAWAVLSGFLGALVLAFPLGMVLGRNHFVGQVVDPLIAGLFAIPRIIFYPVLLGIFGLGLQAVASMGAISAFFPITITTTAAIREVSPTLIKLGRSLNLSPRQMVFKIFLPAAAPTLMVGFRVGFSVAFISVIISEFFAARAGLGLEVSRAYGLLQLPTMFALILLILTIALAGNLTLWWAERRLRGIVT